jgi:hypothetical protein
MAGLFPTRFVRHSRRTVSTGEGRVSWIPSDVGKSVNAIPSIKLSAPKVCHPVFSEKTGRTVPINLTYQQRELFCIGFTPDDKSNVTTGSSASTVKTPDNFLS